MNPLRQNTEYLDNYWNSRGFETYTRNMWIKYDKNRNPKYFSTHTNTINNGTSTLKFFIRDFEGNILLASSDAKEINDFFKKMDRNDIIDDILD